MLDAKQLAETIKREVLELVASGTIPRTCATFSQLHDYCDANVLGAQEKLLSEFEALYPPPADESENPALDAHCDVCNAAQTLINAWLASGGIANVVTLPDDLKDSSPHLTFISTDKDRAEYGIPALAGRRDVVTLTIESDGSVTIEREDRQSGNDVLFSDDSPRAADEANAWILGEIDDD